MGIFGGAPKPRSLEGPQNLDFCRGPKTKIFDDFCNVCFILFFDFYVLLLELASTTVARFWVEFWTDMKDIAVDFWSLCLSPINFTRHGGGRAEGKWIHFGDFLGYPTKYSTR